MKKDNGSLKTAVLLCGEIGIDGEEIRQWLPQAVQGVDVHIVPDLCSRPEEISKLVGPSGASRLVLGLCSMKYAAGEVQTQARKAGLDALGVEVIDLRVYAASVHPRPQATEKAKILLAAAVKRARAFPGSKPENAKPYLSGRVSRRSLFKLSLSEYRSVPSVQESRCAADLGCKACVQVCPQGALGWSDGRVGLDKMKCDLCGLCITACPREALINPVITSSQVEAHVSTLLDPAIGTLKPRGVFFTCQFASAPKGPYYAGWLPIQVPCVGMVPPSWLLAPLILGASAVVVLPCKGKCPFGQNEIIEGRVSFCQEFLRLIGAPKNLVTLSPALDQPLPEGSKRVSLENPFSQDAPAYVLMKVAQEYNADEVVLEHPRSPLGLVEVRSDVCTGCGMCARICPTGALTYEERDESMVLTFGAPTCVGCGQCLLRCPEAEYGAITLTNALNLERLIQGRRVIYREDILRCLECGAPIAAMKMMERVEELLGGEYADISSSILTRYCPDCRSIFSFSRLGERNQPICPFPP